MSRRGAHRERPRGAGGNRSNIDAARGLFVPRRGRQNGRGRLVRDGRGAFEAPLEPRLACQPYQSIFTRTPMVRGLLKKRRFEPGLALMLVAYTTSVRLLT